MENANVVVAVFPSAVRAANNDSGEQQNQYARGAHIVIDMQAVPGVDTVTFTLEGKDAFGNWYTILASAALSAAAVTVLRVFPGLVAAANAAANDVIPRAWRLRAAHSAGTNFTYRATANLIL